MTLGVPGGCAVETPRVCDTERTISLVPFAPPVPPDVEPSSAAVVAYPHPSLHPQIEAAVEAVRAVSRASRMAAAALLPRLPAVSPQ